MTEVDRMAVIAHGVEWPQPIYVHAEGDGANLSLRRVAQNWKRIDVVPADQLRGAVEALRELVEASEEFFAPNSKGAPLWPRTLAAREVLNRLGGQ